MTLAWQNGGLGHVPSYQASGAPYLTSSLALPAESGEPVRLDFPGVTRFLVITNVTPASAASAPLRFGFSRNGVKGVENTNYGVLNNAESFTAELRCASLFLISDTATTATGSVVAGVTDIAPRYCANNWSGSLGVG